ncbi:MAG: O-antigen ligase family protein [Bacteroides sp.]|nr:O-antigen ligase family protein [Bacteroides sp.]
MLSIIVMLILWLLLKVKVTGKMVVLSSVSILLLFSILYFYKKDSADGRLLIWQCSWEMIKEKPLLGHGIGGFQANYMNYQANYFKQNPDSSFVRLADSTNRAFNEYVLLIVNYGFVGLIFFFAFVCFLWVSYRRNRCLQSKFALLSLTGIAVFSCFSYPLSYPFVWVVILFCVYVIISFANYPITVSLKIKRGIYLSIICLSLVSIIYASAQIQNYVAWGKIAKVSLIRQTDKTFAQYDKLLPKLKNNRLFLYNYAAELNYGGYYFQSQQIAEECNKLWADFDLQILMGYNCMKMEQYEKAEMYFEQASYMCPVRFIPLHELMNVYQLKGEEEKAIKMAGRIIDKPIKIPSRKIDSIKEKAREYLRLKGK